LLQQLVLALTRLSPLPLLPQHPHGAQSTVVTLVGAAYGPPVALQHLVVVARGCSVSADGDGMSITTVACSCSNGSLGF